MEAATHLSLVDPNTGEFVDQPTFLALQSENAQLHEDVANLESERRHQRSQITKLKNELSQALGVEPEAEEITEVLVFWNVTLKKGRCKIVVGSERWLKVRARLREKDVRTKEPCYSVLHLKAAVIGVLFSEFHMANGHTDAATIFRDSKTVDDHIARVTSFKRTYGVSALSVVDELAGEGLRWLAERCSCSHLWIAHLRGGPRPDGTLPCSECQCSHFDDFTAKVDRFMLEREAS